MTTKRPDNGRLSVDTEIPSPFTLPNLPYDLDDLAPHVSRETLEYHHGRHHSGYVARLNELVRGTPFADRSLEQIIMTAEGPLYGNAAQHWNHSFYWRCLSPEGGGAPGSRLGDAIVSRWQTVDRFKEAFSDVALKIFGSGWAWLVLKDGSLALETTKDGDCPLTTGSRPLLGVDAWEHAYYIDYRNERAAYLEAFWKIVNWDFAAANLDASWRVS